MQLDQSLTKRILGRVFVYSLKSGQFGSSLVSSILDEGISPKFLPEQIFSQYTDELVRRGLVQIRNDAWMLTSVGRKNIIVVMMGGGFDIIHPGHIEALRQAKSLGDVLVVSVARDTTFRRNKDKNPIHSEALRQELVASVKFVDAAVLGSEKDIFETVKFLRPDVIALGYDQLHTENAVYEGASKVGIQCKVVRLKSSLPSIKTSTITANQKKDQLLTET